MAAMAIPLAHAASLATTKSTGYQAPNANWTVVGCTKDKYPDGRDLIGDYKSSSKLTPTSCLEFCDKGQWAWAGIEDGNQCFCGNDPDGAIIGPNGSNLTAQNNDGCTTPSAGDAGSNGGGPNHLLLFSSKRWPRPHIPRPENSDYEGCFADDVNNRLLPHYANVASLTNQKCFAACGAAGYDLAGTEDKSQCWCGHSSKTDLSGSTAADPSPCQLACEGDLTQYCGGYSYLSLYKSIS
ncbi:WSC-domain-containing protein [Microstroma glucosiphilum]|uniref:WSC-domain-containing protein n=1 Tax=Pseudomicrostroma glucosiphilum TaxID=1684307 RepID=A0A316UDX4_9BASI|nr:WSC-domain-containing protein [Pseudomicrostroma glucosiphilum]PWN21285.1 WSC-domain-containing protein [Pseudomicrostroma glucosiphilum]